MENEIIITINEAADEYTHECYIKAAGKCYPEAKIEFDTFAADRPVRVDCGDDYTMADEIKSFLRDVANN
jgi:hypothetical protein